MAGKKNLQQCYEACMVLSGAADALSYNGDRWEFENSGTKIHAEVAEKGGLKKLDVGDFRVSDDTVMHLATAKALVKSQDGQSLSNVYQKLAREYVKCMRDMSGRASGMTCVESVNILKANKSGWKIPFNQRGGGCGAAMRAMCIDLRFPRPEAEKVLVAVSVESGRMTHHHPTGYLGALASALFTAYAVQGKALTQWGHGLLETLKKAKEYVRMSDHYVDENLNNWDYFETQWRDYLTERGILNGEPQARFPEHYGVEEWDKFYVSLSFSGWGGSSGHDAPMIAYDGLLSAGASWEKLAEHSFHGGDSDSTAAIAAAWWGAIYGYAGVPAVNYERLEYRNRLVNLANKLYELKDTPICLRMEPEEAACPASHPIPSLCEVRQ